jgi:hypothetical protein
MDPSPTAKLTMACDSAWTATFLSVTGAATGTGSPTPLGDLDGDGCDDLRLDAANITASRKRRLLLTVPITILRGFLRY